MPTPPLMLAAFRAYTAARVWPECVSPAVPVLYFGDEPAYRASPKRIITVALNPSLAEFPEGNPWQRFPAACTVYPAFTGAATSLSTYKALLDQYFNVDPYRRWFGHLEPMLHGFDASFFPGRTNRVLHTDIMTPVPTNPVWSGIDSPTVRVGLMSAGIPLWLDLVRELQPHIALVSIAREHLTHIVFAGVVKPWTAVHSLPVRRASKPATYVLEHQVVQLNHAHQMDVLFGPKLRQPFGGLSNPNKRSIGVALRRRLTHW